MKNDAKGLLIIISGPSGVGKGTLIERVTQKLAQRGIETAFSVSATTRMRADGEIDGVHYYFVSRERFEEMIENGEVAEYNRYGGNYYGTPCRNIDTAIENGTPMILDIDVNGKEQILEKYDNCVTVFILPPCLEILEERIRFRARSTDTEESIRYRLERAEEEMKLKSEYKYEIINDDLETAADELCAIITKEEKQN